VGIPCGEALAMPGGPAGLRFERARDRALAAAGVDRVLGRVTAVLESAAEGPLEVRTADGASLRADTVVLATGGLLGGGVEYAPSDPSEPRTHPPLRLGIAAPVVIGVGGRRLEAPGTLAGASPEQIAWPFAPQGILECAGVLADAAGHCLGSGPAGLLVAGELVADAPRAWLSALESGARAGEAAVSGAGAAARGPASRP
jgi:hypothetical protein